MHIAVDDVVLVQGQQAMQHVRHHQAQAWQGGWLAGCAERKLNPPAPIGENG